MICCDYKTIGRFLFIQTLWRTHKLLHLFFCSKHTTASDLTLLDVAFPKPCPEKGISLR